MKTYEETVKSVFEKSAVVEKEQAVKKKRTVKAAVVCGSFLIVAGCVLGFLKSGNSNGKELVIPENSNTADVLPSVNEETTKSSETALKQEPENGEQEEYQASPSVTKNSLQTTTASTEQIKGEEQKSSDGLQKETKKDADNEKSYGDGVFGGFFIPCVPQGEVVTEGEAITDEEAKRYFEENTSIISALSSSGVQTENLKIAEKGYCHVSYSGVENEKLTVKVNHRDYLVYSNDSLVAIITLFRDESGKIFDSPAFGAPWFDEYNNFLCCHKNEKLLYVYAGSAEIVITPENEILNPLGLDAERYFEGIENPYERFYNENAVYVP